MMGSKAIEPKLYLSSSLDAHVPPNHLVHRLAAAVDFDFVRGLSASTTATPDNHRWTRSSSPRCGCSATSST